jgi:coenzyme F420 hydrogenase subunit beta
MNIRTLPQPDGTPPAAPPTPATPAAAGAAPESPALARVQAGRLCAGCGGCAAVAPAKIGMALEPPGYLRPVQRAPLSDEEERDVAAICPGLTLEQRAEGRADDPLWGPYLSVWTGHATDPALRHAASSGGALSALLVHLLESGAVEFVLHTAADPENPLGNRTVLSRTAADVMAAAGSRYAPSAPLAGIEEHLAAASAAGRRFAFVGKPCDVGALRSLARRDPRVDACIPVMLSFFCAGVPAQRGAEAVLERLGVRPDEVAAFRYRGNGWPGQAVATLADGSERGMSYLESWGRTLAYHVQFRCKICPDGVGGLADLVCADAWECDEEGYPLFEEAEGTSLVLARTARGAALLDGAVAAGRISVSPFAVGGITAMQPGQKRRKTVLAARLAALRLLMQPVPRYRGFRLLAAASRAPLRGLVANFVGTARRVLSRPR